MPTKYFIDCIKFYDSIKLQSMESFTARRGWLMRMMMPAGVRRGMGQDPSGARMKSLLAGGAA